jgi:hypothetical protein
MRPLPVDEPDVLDGAKLDVVPSAKKRAEKAPPSILQAALSGSMGEAFAKLERRSLAWNVEPGARREQGDKKRGGDLWNHPSTDVPISFSPC